MATTHLTLGLVPKLVCVRKAQELADLRSDSHPSLVPSFEFPPRRVDLIVVTSRRRTAQFHSPPSPSDKSAVKRRPNAFLKDSRDSDRLLFFSRSDPCFRLPSRVAREERAVSGTHLPILQNRFLRLNQNLIGQSFRRNLHGR